jgi:hypothetical protein
MLTYVLATLYFLAGMFLFIAIVVRPRLFWPLLFAGAVFSAGLMVGGYTIVDEYFIGGVILGGALAVVSGKAKFYSDKKSFLDHLHGGAFALFVSYMIFQSARGALLLSSPEKLRWLIFFIILGLVGFAASKKIFYAPRPRRVALVIASSFTAYLVYYIGYGYFTELLRGVSRFSIQPGEWSTTAYAMFGVVVGAPAAIILTQDKSRKYQMAGWFTMVLTIGAAAYYLVRTALVAILAFFIVSLPKLGIKKIIFFSLVFILVVVIFYGAGKGRNFVDKGKDIFESIYSTGQDIRFWENSDLDIDRRVHLLASFVAVDRDWNTRLFGYGYRMHGYVIGPYLRQLYEEKGFPENARAVTANESTEGFTALLIDTGWVGMFLLALNFFLVGIKILSNKKGKNRLLLSTSLALAFLWLPVINMLDVVLFYLLIMPNGIIIQLNEGTVDLYAG